MNQYYKSKALEKLQNNWGTAVLVSFLASILGNLSSGAISFTYEITQVQSISAALTSPNQLIEVLKNMDSNPIEMLTTIFKRFAVLPAFRLIIVFSLIFVVGLSFISAAVAIGHCYFYINLTTDKHAEVSDLFAFFKIIGRAWLAEFLTTIIISVLSLLCIIPGIIAAYCLAMVPYIIADDPTIGPVDAMRKSREMMAGHKLEFFLLELSFIGWALLCVCTCGIGTLFLTPYICATKAAYYADLSGHNAIGQEETEYTQYPNN